MSDNHDRDDEFDLPDDSPAVRRLAQVQSELRASRTELRRTIRALRSRHKTPRQIRELIEKARCTVYRSVLLGRRLGPLHRVH